MSDPTTSDSSTKHESIYALVCTVGELSCVVETSDVVETMRPLHTEPIVGAPEYVAGISIIRDLPTPVIDLSTLLGLTDEAPARYVTVKTNNRQVALAVGAVNGVVDLDLSSFESMPSMLDLSGNDFVERIGTLGNELTYILNTARIVPPSVLSLLDSALQTQAHAKHQHDHN